MKLSRGYRPWLLADQHGYRPLLEHAYVSPDGWLAVADGSIAGVFPAELEETDIPGLVLASILQRATAATRAGKPVQLRLGEREVTFHDGAEPRCLPLQSPSADDPLSAWPLKDWGAFIDKHVGGIRANGPSVLAFNPQLLRRLALALDAERGLAFAFGRKRNRVAGHWAGPIVVRGLDVPPDAPLAPPFGLLMPMAPWPHLKVRTK